MVGYPHSIILFNDEVTTLFLPQVVCIDEATSSVDSETDALVQSVLRRCLSDRTVLTIAHRVGTVLSSSDRVLVMDGGQLAEEGPPDRLLRDPETAFSRMVADSSATRRDRRDNLP